MLLPELDRNHFERLTRWIKLACLVAIIYQALVLSVMVYYAVKTFKNPLINRSPYLVLKMISSLIFGTVYTLFFGIVINATIRFYRSLEQADSYEWKPESVHWLTQIFKFNFIATICSVLNYLYTLCLPYFTDYL